jgi:serine/threonine protein kinase
LTEEINIYKSLCHPFIADCFDYFQFESFFIIVMDYAYNGNLFTFVKQKGKLEEKLACKLFMQLISVLQYLHEVKNVIHKDLRPDHILFGSTLSHQTY